MSKNVVQNLVRKIEKLNAALLAVTCLDFAHCAPDTDNEFHHDKKRSCVGMRDAPFAGPGQRQLLRKSSVRVVNRRTIVGLVHQATRKRHVLRLIISLMKNVGTDGSLHKTTRASVCAPCVPGVGQVPLDGGSGKREKVNWQNSRHWLAVDQF